MSIWHFLIFWPPSGGQKFDVSKVWLHGCLKLSLNLTKRYKVKKVKNYVIYGEKCLKYCIFSWISKMFMKKTLFGIFLTTETKFQVFYAWNLLVRLRESFRHPWSHTFETSNFWPPEGGKKIKKCQIYTFKTNFFTCTNKTKVA